MTDDHEEPSALRRWLWDHPLMQVGGGSGDGFLFFRIFGNRFYRRPWFQATVMPVYGVLLRIHHAKQWVAHRIVPSRRYHVVDTGLTPGYYDEDMLMLHACMALLGKYIKWHGGEESLAKFSQELRDNPDRNAPEGLQDTQADRQDEAIAIWHWWKVEKPADEARSAVLLHILYGGDDRITWEKTENPYAHRMVFKEFEGDEIKMHAEFRALEEKIREDEQKMLHRLVDLRPSLWT